MTINANNFAPFDVTKIPSGPTNILKDKWFWCLDGEPTKALFYKKYSPQCNSSKEIAETFRAIPREIPRAKLIFIDIAYAPLDMRS